MYWSYAQWSRVHLTRLLFGATLESKGAARITNIMQHQKMLSASPGASHRKPTRRPGRKAPALRPDRGPMLRDRGPMLALCPFFL